MVNAGSRNSNQVTLLLVGCEPASVALLSQLDSKAYALRIAELQEQVLQLACSHHFGLLLLDLTSRRISGYELLQKVRQEPSSARLPIIVLTDLLPGDKLLALLSLGADDYLVKPFDLATATARIQTQVRRRGAEEALRESEERYFLAGLGSNDGLWDWNLTTQQVYYSPRLKAMLGLQDSEMGTSPEEIVSRIHPEDIEKVKASIDAHLEGQTPCFESEHRLLHKDGFYRWMFTRALALRDSDGKPTRMAGSQTDITGSKVVDPLTGLPNRSLFMDRLARSLERAKRRPGYLFAILFLDLDRFKAINDSLGHSNGDLVILSMVRRLQGCLRSGDSLARCGPDEFLLHLDDIKHVSDATRVAERICNGLLVPFDLNSQEVFVSASIGIALSETGYDRPEDLLRDAEIAMLRSKSSARDRFEVFDSAMRERTLERLQMETDLRRALERQEFCNHYQPIISLADGRVAGFEALVRWNHPTRGLVPPGDFIPLAEETGMIVPLGQWVLREACQQLKRWQIACPEIPPVVISVNLSSRQLMEPGLIEHVDGVLQETRLTPDLLRLEITESTIMENADAAVSRLIQLRFLGVHLSIDDFGTGYSSLSRLQSFPVDTLKIDRSFVHAMGSRADHLEIIRTIVALAHNLDMDIVAEGVEASQQVSCLKDLGCEYAQGYHFSKPIDSQNAALFLMSNTFLNDSWSSVEPTLPPAQLQSSGLS